MARVAPLFVVRCIATLLTAFLVVSRWVEVPLDRRQVRECVLVAMMDVALYANASGDKSPTPAIATRLDAAECLGAQNVRHVCEQLNICRG